MVDIGGVDNSADLSSELKEVRDPNLNSNREENKT
jgi:hypothetical protein